MFWKPLLLATAVFSGAASSWAQANAGARPSLTPEERKQGFSNRTLLAKPRAALAVGDVDAAEIKEGRTARKTFSRLGNLRVIEKAPGESVTQAIAALRASGRYEFVEPDYYRQREALPNDPRFVAGDQWFLRNTGQTNGVAGADVGAVAAWDIRTDASAAIVAIIDTGVRQTHEDLVANLWTNPGEIAGNGIDDDKNGFVDDVHGINTLVAAGSPGSGNPDDDMGHGTAVAGVIGGVGNNGKGISGIAWTAKIMALKWDDLEGSAVTSNEVACIDYAIAKGARIINISYGGTYFSQAEYDALKRARDAGIIVVVSAGNDSLDVDVYPHYPGNYLLDNVVAVAATDRRDALSDFSNSGVGLTELAAPGTAILTTDRTGDTAYEEIDGTSFASPMVAGALAMLQAQFPTDTYHGLINRLLRSVDPLPALAGKVQTGGRLNLARALASTTDRPFNDDFATRVALSGSNLAVRTHSQKATAEAGEPAHAGVTAGATLWWSWTAPVSGEVAVETGGSNFDTNVAVYTGTTLAALTVVGFNDDNGGVLTSSAAFIAVAGTTYQIAVGGKAGATGAIVLTLGLKPPNDRFDNAITLTGPSLRVAGFNTVSGKEPGEPVTATDAKGRTVWYKWVAPATRSYTFSIFAYGFDAVGAVYSGNAGVAALTRLGVVSTKTYNEGIYFDAIADRTYYFQVDSVDASGGFFDVALIDGVSIEDYYPFNSTPAFNPTTDVLVYLNTYGYLNFFYYSPIDLKFGELDGTLDVQSPAIGADGSTYIGDDFGYLYAYNPDSTRRWKRDLGLVSVTSSPAIGADGAIYVHTDDGYLHGYFPDNTLKWKASVPGVSYSSPVIGSDGTIYIGAEDEYLYALSPLDGALLWRFKADGEIYSSPAIDNNGALYFGTLNGKFYSITSTGTLRWVFDAGAPISSSPAIDADGTVYFGCYDGGLYALTSTGTLRWKILTADEIRASSPAIASDGTIYIGSYDGYVHVVSSLGARRRVYATGAYIRASPMIAEGTLYQGSGDGRFYISDLSVTLSTSAQWPMHRHNSRHTGRRPSTGAPRILASPKSVVIPNGASATLAVNADGANTLAFQWQLNGDPIVGATHSTYAVSSTSPGTYSVVVTNSAGSATSAAAAVGLALQAGTKVIGAASEVGANIAHPLGNIFDQILLEGASASFTADAEQITRLSFVDSSNDIVQIEFSGAGTVSLALDTPTGPAAPVNYNQATLYMKGRVGIVVTGANETSNLSVFSVGRGNAVNQALFKDTVTYDGVADIAFISIQSFNGKFGGLRTANARYSATKGITGLFAPGVQFLGPMFIGNINAMGTATPMIVIGSGVNTQINGGDLRQTNGLPVQVAGLTQLKFVLGSTSHHTVNDPHLLPAQINQGRLEQDGVNISNQIVVYPPP